MLFKSCVGMGFFSYPYIFSLAGVWLGTLLSLILCYLSTYGMYSIARVTSLVEDEDFKYGEMINDYNSKKAHFSNFSPLLPCREQVQGPQVGVDPGYFGDYRNNY